VFKPPLGPRTRYLGQPVLVSECGGHGFYPPLVSGDLLDQYRTTVAAIARRPLFQGYCYTQAYDTFQERNGLLTFARQPKVPLEDLRAINESANRTDSQ
jgi:hypothetical protein